ncbi:uncharacterized protein LOC108667348 isoform X2 [Hyalella azteca]|uniref:Uncharacterized protein LOC108667348 isoform X2 n=1 Tax=Hyalella azteca TaxID=294128 RepID=A0A979FIB0_HYAAZ|nr:uncharacterized protein LOC108667348 isoform X2 [Hyalella azteca]
MKIKMKECRVVMHKLSDAAVKRGWHAELNLIQTPEVCRVESDEKVGGNIKAEHEYEEKDITVKKEPKYAGDEITVKEEPAHEPEYEEMDISVKEELEYEGEDVTVKEEPIGIDIEACSCKPPSHGFGGQHAPCPSSREASKMEAQVEASDAQAARQLLSLAPAVPDILTKLAFARSSVMKNTNRPQSSDIEDDEQQQRQQQQQPDDDGKPFSQTASAVASRRKRLIRKKIYEKSTPNDRPHKKRKIDENQLEDPEMTKEEKGIIIGGVDIFKNISYREQKYGVLDDGPPRGEKPFLSHTIEDDLVYLLRDPSGLLYKIELYMVKAQARKIIIDAFTARDSKQKRTKSGTSSKEPSQEPDQEQSKEQSKEPSQEPSQDSSLPGKEDGDEEMSEDANPIGCAKPYSRTRGKKKKDGCSWACMIPVCEGMCLKKHMMRHYKKAHGFSEEASFGMNRLHRRVDNIHKMKETAPTLNVRQIARRVEAITSELINISAILPAISSADMLTLSLPINVLMVLLDGMGKGKAVADQFSHLRGVEKPSSGAAANSSSIIIPKENEEEARSGSVCLDVGLWRGHKVPYKIPEGRNYGYLQKGEFPWLRYVVPCPYCLAGCSNATLGLHIKRRHEEYSSPAEMSKALQSVLPVKRLVKLIGVPGEGEAIRKYVPHDIMESIKQAFRENSL